MNSPADKAPDSVSAYRKRLVGRLILATTLFVGSPCVLALAAMLAAESPRMAHDDWYDIKVVGVVALFAGLGMLAGASLLLLALFSSPPWLDRSKLRSIRSISIAFAIAFGAIFASRAGGPLAQALAFLFMGLVGLFLCGVPAVVAIVTTNRHASVTGQHSATGQRNAADKTSPRS